MKLEQTNADISTYGKKYHFYYNEENQTIVCTTIYKGQMVRGIAKCSPEDNFDIDIGKRLAYFRCKQKFAQKKLNRALKVYKDAVAMEAKARNDFSKAAEFVSDSGHQLRLASNELINLERELAIKN